VRALGCSTRGGLSTSTSVLCNRELGVHPQLRARKRVISRFASPKKLVGVPIKAVGGSG
jgi:hypothetical protein